MTRLPVFVIVMTVVIDAMGIGLIIPVLPDLIREVTGKDLAHAAIWGGVLETVFAVMQFLFAPMLGSLSDAKGRRPVLLVSLVVVALVYGMMAVAGTMWLLLAARIFGGIASATHATAAAYMADISAPHEKAARFGLIGAGFGIGFVLGPAFGGLLAEFGTRAPFWAAGGLALANAALGYFVLSETVTDRIRRSFSWRRANPLSAFFDISRIKGAAPLLGVIFLYHVSTAVYPAIWPFFTGEMFGWSPAMIGASLAVYGVSLAVTQGALVAPTIRILGDRGAVMLGLLLELMALVILGFITSGTLLMWLIPLLGLAGIGLPALQGITSRMIADDMQGTLQGVQTSLASLAMIITPLVATQVFAAFSHAGATPYLPGAPFLVSAALMVLAIIAYLRALKRNTVA